MWYRVPHFSWVIYLPSDPCGSEVLEGTDALPPTSPHACKGNVPSTWYRHSKFISLGWLHSVAPMPTKTGWFAGGLLVKPLVPCSTRAPCGHSIPFKKGIISYNNSCSSHKTVNLQVAQRHRRSYCILQPPLCFSLSISITVIDSRLSFLAQASAKAGTSASFPGFVFQTRQSCKV